MRMAQLGGKREHGQTRYRRAVLRAALVQLSVRHACRPFRALSVTSSLPSEVHDEIALRT